MSYIVYAPSEEELSSIATPEAVIICEIWSKLPPVDFTKAKTVNHSIALRADGPDHYVWVPPSTFKALENGRPVLCAIGKRYGKIMDFYWVDAKPDAVSYEDFIISAKAFNAEQFARAKEQRTAVRGKRKAS